MTRVTKIIPFGILVLLITFLALLSSVTPVLAWEDSGHYWEGHVLPDPLYFLIDEDVSTESWTGWYNAHELWNEATDSPTNFTYTENPLIELIFCEYNYDSGLGISGKTWYTPPFEGEIWSVDVTMYEVITDGYPYYKRVSVAGHEFGHALGLDDYPGPYLMEPSDYTRYNTYSVYSPQEDDVDGVLYLY